MKQRVLLEAFMNKKDYRAVWSFNLAQSNVILISPSGHEPAALWWLEKFGHAVIC